MGNTTVLVRPDSERTQELKHFARIIADEVHEANKHRLAGITLGEMFEKYMNDYAKLHTRSWRAFENHYRLYLVNWSDRDIGTIKTSEVIALQADLAKRWSKGGANHGIELLRMVLNKAIAWDLLETKNPVAKVKLFKFQPRERFLQPEEISAFLEAVNSLENDRVRDYILMLLWTGQRRGNVSQMRWADLDLVRGVWRIPITKNGMSHTIPLVAQAVAIIEARTGCHPEFVFPKQDGSGPMVNVQNAWRSVLRKSGLRDLRLHDARRTLASWQVATGASLPIVGRTLNHQDASSTQIYARLHLGPVRQSMETAIDSMLGAAHSAAPIKKSAPPAYICPQNKGDIILTEVEKAVLAHLAEGSTYRAIADQLNRSMSSIDDTIGRLADRLGVPRGKRGKSSLRTLVVVAALERGLIERNDRPRIA